MSIVGWRPVTAKLSDVAISAGRRRREPGRDFVDPNTIAAFDPDA